LSYRGSGGDDFLFQNALRYIHLYLKAEIENRLAVKTYVFGMSYRFCGGWVMTARSPTPRRLRAGVMALLDTALTPR